MLRRLTSSDPPSIGEAAILSPTSVRWIGVHEAGTPEAIQRALSSDVAMQWVSQAGQHGSRPVALIQVTALDLRSRTAELDVQLLRPLSEATELSSDVSDALDRTLLAFPLRRVYSKVLAQWSPLYETVLPGGQLEATLPEHHYYQGAYCDQAIYCVVMDTDRESA